MPLPASFDEFLPAFFALFTQTGFRGADFSAYLTRPANQRSGDEASVVDTALIGPLLGLLGFAPAERVYNLQKGADRPDFAPEDAAYGTCFMAEDKSTSLALTLDLSDPESHLSQLSRYVRSQGLLLGWLTNGRRFTAWKFDNPDTPTQIIDIEVLPAVQQWAGGPGALSPENRRALHDLWDLFRKDAFAGTTRLIEEIAIGVDEWRQRALPLGTGSGHEKVLAETLRLLVQELQHEARRILTGHLTRYAEFIENARRVADADTETAEVQLQAIRATVITALEQARTPLGLDPADMDAVETSLLRLEQGPRAFPSLGALMADVLAVINAARLRKHGAGSKHSRPWRDLAELAALEAALKVYGERAFAWHHRRAALRQTYRADIAVHEDYAVWESLVQETMLGGMNEGQRHDEFALQAAYVVFIRLLLIRVCEDKGIFPHRFLSDGGLQHWREDIERYLKFASGNPYTPLLDMAYANAQNIYAHFFTGRELFNWFILDEAHLLMALHRLVRFNFAGVDSDIVGTVYNTYVDREEKQNKGQYYTPTPIVDYILDTVGYTAGPAVIGGSKRLIDPACGSGTFLVRAAKRLVAAYQGTAAQVQDPVAVLDRVQNALYGFDLNPFACYLAETNLLIQVLDLVKAAHDAGHRPTLRPFHIYNVDALTRSSGLYQYVQYGTLQAEENDEVDQIKCRAPGSPYANGFAFVVANPPYGASLSPPYRETLRQSYQDVFRGQPDTYVFFLKLGLELLASNGKMGFITPNTYLMGVNTAPLRSVLLGAGRVEEIVDLPQNIWADATVDCTLLFLAADTDAARRNAQEVRVNLMGLSDNIAKLTARDWAETLTQPQSAWTPPAYEINIRHDTLLQQIEDACRTSVGGSAGTVVLRLGTDTDQGPVTESTQGIIPYITATDGAANLYIKPQRDVPAGEPGWGPLLDSTAYVGRYELRWGKERPYLKYGGWLGRPREARFFTSPKLVLVRLRNRSLKRRLVATFDGSGFYNRDNFNNIITDHPDYDLKYLLALFNSSLLNYWYKRRFDNVNVNPDTFRQLPIFSANANTQAELVTLVDQMLEKQAALNVYREQGYIIKRRAGAAVVTAPYDLLLSELQQADPSFPTLSLFDARYAAKLRLPDQCDLSVTVSSNVFTPARHPETVVLRHRPSLYLEVPDERLRRFLVGYLSAPRWRDRNWNYLKDNAFVPEDDAALDAFFEKESQRIAELQQLVSEVETIDADIDDRVLNLYGITDTADRARILGSAPRTDDETEASETAQNADSETAAEADTASADNSG